MNKSDLSILGPKDSLIIGDWFLKETIIASTFPYDSIPIIRNEVNQNRKITFTTDSLIIHPFSDRYYKSYEGYGYSLNDWDLKLFLGSNKKKQEVGEYSIAQCTFTELIVRSYERLDTPFFNEFVTVYYIYHRNDEYALILKQLYGKWSECSESPISFLDKDITNKSYFYKDTLCENRPHSIILDFGRATLNLSNEYSITSNNYNSGVFISPSPFYIDISKNLIYLKSVEIMVYKYEFLERDKISFELIKTIPAERK
jgi:hypothetical protein